jgi:hypothetical protein
MASLYEYLLQSGTPSEERIAARDPFLNAASVAQSARIIPQTSAEAVYVPTIQGFLTGLLGGIGKQRVEQELYNQYSALPGMGAYLAGRPASADYGPLTLEDSITAESPKYVVGADVPEDFSSEAAKSDFVRAMFAQDAIANQQEESRKQAAKMQELLMGEGAMLSPEGGLVAIPGLAEIKAEGAAAIESAKQKAQGGGKSWYDKMSASEKEKIGLTEGVAGELERLAQEAKDLKMNALEFQPSTLNPGSKAELLYSQMINIVPNAVRVMGQAGDLNAQEQQRMINSTIGNWLSGTESIASRLKALANQARSISKSRLETHKKASELGGEALIKGFKAKQDEQRFEIRTAPDGKRYKVLLGQ